MKDFLTFRKMLTPWLMQWFFWIAVVIFIFIAIMDIIHQESWHVVLEILILGPLASRIVCEIIILFFRIQDTLTVIKNQLTHSHHEHQ